MLHNSLICWTSLHKMTLILLLLLLINRVICEYPSQKIVKLDEGLVSGEKHWMWNFYEFFEIPYASVPTGRDRFKGPLPPKPWNDTLYATYQQSACPQTIYYGENDEYVDEIGEEECLLISLFVPTIASTKNLIPVVVYIHSGGYAGGNGNMAKYNYLARNNVLVVSLNFRLGAIGFICLGTEEIPGNAGLKDIVAALKWIQKNIKKFGGDPKRVTIAGYSVGAALAELLLLSKTTEGLIDKMILESGSALSPFAINSNPISTATNIAISLGYNNTGSLKDLTEFYFNTPTNILASKSRNYFLGNSTFGFAPCIENVHEGIEPFLTESPIDIMKRGDYPKVPVLTGFASMEGISRSIMFEQWIEEMKENFEHFVPADLSFPDNKTKENVIKEIVKYYFKNHEIFSEDLQGYIDYFSDSMFKYSILKSAKIHAEHSNRPIYFYEFDYVGGLSMKHKYMDTIKGASHRDQSAYVVDFYGWTNLYADYDMRDTMTIMWSDFLKFENPTEYECQLIVFKWPKYTLEDQSYLKINTTSKVRTKVLADGYEFWDKIYDKHYQNPKAPSYKSEERPKKITNSKK